MNALLNVRGVVMDDTVVPFDLWRMFIGEHPPLFYLEVLFRTLLIYSYTLGLIRWIGGRSVAQLSMTDMLLVIALGSAVGDATFYPDVPLLEAMLVITAIVLLNKGLDALAARSQTANRLIDGRAIAVVRDGCIDIAGRKAGGLSMAEIKSMLRRQGVANLGQVEIALLEEGGGVSVFGRRQAGPGLSLLPPDDLLQNLPLRIPGEPVDGQLCCTECGNRQQRANVRADEPCTNCGNRNWTTARLLTSNELNQLD
ncbi:DUF421 domain-containing protein [Paracoccus acridae]|uniref:DUF421 domain-containing protein n=1 Tax=Paracoccus acridae TaxID=1795310 RepID=A0ABQ1VN13_9RHOB|nr:YetF domain-containing protein [Paracoccus acridae]GGF79996.1 DUF421 domain-containing protein [Paracoccus acridae]